MKKLINSVAIVIFVIFMAYNISCSQDKSDSQNKGDIQSDTIDWTKYDIGLKQAAEDGKYVMAYFWRDG